MDNLLKQLAQTISKQAQGVSKTPLASFVPGAQLMGQALQTMKVRQPTIGDVSKAVLYNPETKTALPMSPLHRWSKPMTQMTQDNQMNEAMNMALMFGGVSPKGSIMQAQSVKDIMRQQGDDVLAAIEQHLPNIANPSKNPTALDDFSDLTDIKDSLVKNKEGTEEIRKAMEILHRNSVDIGQQMPKMNLDQIQAATEGAQKPLLYQFSKATDNNTKKSIIDQMIKNGGYTDYVPVLQRSIK